MNVFSSAVSCVAVRSMALAVDPVLFPLKVCAAICAALAFVTALFAIVVERDPAEFVTSPVNAGTAAVGRAVTQFSPVAAPEFGVKICPLVPTGRRSSRVEKV